MADTRTRRQKLEAVVAPDSGATDGERENARALLDKMEPEPVAQASEPEQILGFSPVWDLFWSLDGVTKRQLHDQGILMAWDENGICVICGRRH